MKQLSLIFILLFICTQTFALRIKDMSSVQGVRENQLIGYGLVVGLDGTGDKAPFTNQTFNNMMKQFGITVPAGTDPKLKNVAAVAVHATLPAFAKPGQKIDITASSIGNAKSLRGGTLLMTPLKGIDGKIYGLAQGSLVVGGFGADGADGSSIKVNVQVVGRIPNGASVERTVSNSFNEGDHLTFNLTRPDFTTATHMAKTINDLFGQGAAYAMDASSIRVTAPRDANQRVSFLSIVENLEVVPGNEAAKIVINSRTGTIVIGQNVRVHPVAVTHGSLTVSIKNTLDVSQPDGLSDGQTAVIPDTEINIDQENNKMFIMGPAVTLDDIVTAVNEIGAAPGDLMAILEALKQAGALEADIVVI
ncbi:flagellar basal body P-ring protein FlgI [Marinicellulosiphila megalodicopiae]|uniref:flagellar basal body P-ring protein FlgI n=1 Tax=Marinicellulosiphila megalodicopiae TaxID=2724896 RepID=UPI003BB04ADA